MIGLQRCFNGAISISLAFIGYGYNLGLIISHLLFQNIAATNISQIISKILGYILEIIYLVILALIIAKLIKVIKQKKKD